MQLSQLFFTSEDIHLNTKPMLNGKPKINEDQNGLTLLVADIRPVPPYPVYADSIIKPNVGKMCETVVHRTIEQHGGMVGQPQGSSFTAVFGLNGDGNHASQAVTAALCIMDELTEINREQQTQGEPAFRVGIGVNTESSAKGNSLTGALLTGGRFSASVRTAKEISELNKQTPFHTIFISEQTRRRLGDLHEWHLENLGPVTLPTSDQITVHAVMYRSDISLTA